MFEFFRQSWTWEARIQDGDIVTLTNHQHVTWWSVATEYCHCMNAVLLISFVRSQEWSALLLCEESGIFFFFSLTRNCLYGLLIALLKLFSSYLFSSFCFKFLSSWNAIQDESTCQYLIRQQQNVFIFSVVDLNTLDKTLIRCLSYTH